MTSDEFAALQKKVEQLKQDRDKALGAQAELSRRLKKEYGLNSLKEAKARIKELEAKQAKLDEQIARAEASLRTDYPDLED